MFLDLILLCVHFLKSEGGKRMWTEELEKVLGQVRSLLEALQFRYSRIHL